MEKVNDVKSEITAIISILRKKLMIMLLQKMEVIGFSPRRTEKYIFLLMVLQQLLLMRQKEKQE